MEKKQLPGGNVYVSKCGRVFDSKGVELTYYPIASGYVRVGIPHPIGTIGVHRAVMMTWNPVENQALLHVNHFDFDKTNNRFDNLDWCTTRENNLHLMIFGGNVKRPVVKCVKGDEEILIEDARQLEGIIGKPLRDIWLAIKGNEEINGWAVTPIIYSDLPVIRKIMETVKRDSGEYRRKIKVLDTDNMTWKEYDCMKTMATEFGVFITHIRHRMSNKDSTRIFAQRYVIHDIDTDTSYLTDELIAEMRTRGSKPTLALKVSTGEFLNLKNSRILTKKYGLSKASVSNWLKAEKIKILDGWVFTYINNDLDAAMKRLTEAARLQ